MDNKIKSNEPAEKEHQEAERDSDSVAQNNCASGTRTSKTTEQSEKAPSPYARWSLLFEAVLVIATCATVGVARSQWKTMERQSNIMKEQLNAMAAQTSAAFQQVSTAKSSIRIANDALKDARDSGKEQSARSEKSLNATIENFRLDQRAWIGPHDLKWSEYRDGNRIVHIKEGQQFRVGVSFKNAGRTPAKKVKSSITFVMLKRGGKPAFADIEKNILNQIGSVIQPNATMTLFPAPDDFVPDKTIISNLSSGANVIYIFGKITYEDVFKKPHFTNYCMFLTDDFTMFSACPFYNETDDKTK